MSIKKIVVSLSILCLTFVLCSCKSSDYKKAMQYYESKDWEQAITMFTSLGDYEDSSEMIPKCKYGQAEALYSDKKFAEALKIFEELGEYENSQECARNCNSHIAMDLYADGKVSEAIDLLIAQGNNEMCQKALNTIVSKEMKLDEVVELINAGVPKISTYAIVYTQFVNDKVMSQGSAEFYELGIDPTNSDVIALEEIANDIMEKWKDYRKIISNDTARKLRDTNEALWKLDGTYVGLCNGAINLFSQNGLESFLQDTILLKEPALALDNLQSSLIDIAAQLKKLSVLNQ